MRGCIHFAIWLAGWPVVCLLILLLGGEFGWSIAIVMLVTGDLIIATLMLKEHRQMRKRGSVLQPSKSTTLATLHEAFIVIDTAVSARRCSPDLGRRMAQLIDQMESYQRRENFPRSTTSSPETIT